MTNKEKKIIRGIELRKISGEDLCLDCCGTGGLGDEFCDSCLGQGVLLTSWEYQTLLKVSGRLDDILDAEIIE